MDSVVDMAYGCMESKLIEEWAHLARRKFSDAEQSEGVEKKALEYGAMIYFNCATELLRERQSQTLLGLVFQHFKEKRKRPAPNFL